MMKIILIVLCTFTIWSCSNESELKNTEKSEPAMELDTVLIERSDYPKCVFYLDDKRFDLFTDTFPRQELIKLKVELEGDKTELINGYNIIPLIKSHDNTLNRLSNNTFDLKIDDSNNCDIRLNTSIRVTYLDKRIKVKYKSAKGDLYKLQDTTTLETNVFRLQECK